MIEVSEKLAFLKYRVKRYKGILERARRGKNVPPERQARYSAKINTLKTVLEDIEFAEKSTDEHLRSLRESWEEYHAKKEAA